MTNKKKVWLGLAVTILCVTSFFGGYFISGFNAKEVGVSDKSGTTVDEKTILTFDEYLNLSNQFQKIAIPEFSLNEDISHLSNGVRAIEPSLSFDKRQYLTLDGEMNFDHDISTERVLYFDSGSKRLAVSLIYTDDYIGNDFLGSDWLAFTEKNHSNSFLISFKNILVMTTFLDEKEVDFSDTNAIHELIVKELANNL